jgi:hypothetical protein
MDECFARPLSEDMHFGGSLRGISKGLSKEQDDVTLGFERWGGSRGGAAKAYGSSALRTPDAREPLSMRERKTTPFGHSKQKEGSMTGQSASKVAFSTNLDFSALGSLSEAPMRMVGSENKRPMNTHNISIQASPIQVSRTSLGGFNSSFSKTPVFRSRGGCASSMALNTPSRSLVACEESPMSVEATPVEPCNTAASMSKSATPFALHTRMTHNDSFASRCDVASCSSLAPSRALSRSPETQ